MLRCAVRSASLLRSAATRRGAERGFRSSAALFAAEEEEERVSDDFDVVIVGAGPGGLSAAIKLRQLGEKAGKELRVCVVEKAPEVGAHTLSGAVIETRALDELLPEWKELGAPLKQEAKEDDFVFLTEKSAFKFPIPPPQMKNHGNYIVRLGHVVAWLGEQAEAAGVEIYPSIAAAQVLHNEDGSVGGIRTNDVGIGRDGKKKASFEPGMDLKARLTLFGEGARGHLTRRLESKFGLREKSGHQTYGIGLKELWEVDPAKHRPGYIQHTVGFPMDTQTYGGSWLYHLEDDGKPLVSLGYVVGLDYKNPYLNPYKEFQRWKTHPAIRPLLEGGEVLQYGARAIVEGGYQSIPQLVFPGGALIGDCAGFLNAPKIKGTHAAMKSGMLAAEAAFEELTKEESQAPITINRYPELFKESWLHKELYEARNIRPSFHWGLWPAMAYSAIDTFLLRGRAPWTLQHAEPDHAATAKKENAKPIDYPKPDGKVTFDLLTNLARSNVYHEEDQPIHLKLKDPKLPLTDLKEYAGPSQRFCPAGVYEYQEDEKGETVFVRNAQNCIHCKTCDIKDTFQNIVWEVPEGGGGPIYSGM